MDGFQLIGPRPKTVAPQRESERPTKSLFELQILAEQYIKAIDETLSGYRSGSPPNGHGLACGCAACLKWRYPK